MGFGLFIVLSAVSTTAWAEEVYQVSVFHVDDSHSEPALVPAKR